MFCTHLYRLKLYSNSVYKRNCQKTVESLSESLLKWNVKYISPLTSLFNNIFEEFHQRMDFSSPIKDDRLSKQRNLVLVSNECKLVELRACVIRQFAGVRWCHASCFMEVISINAKHLLAALVFHLIYSGAILLLLLRVNPRDWNFL